MPAFGQAPLPIPQDNSFVPYRSHELTRMQCMHRWFIDTVYEFVGGVPLHKSFSGSHASVIGPAVRLDAALDANVAPRRRHDAVGLPAFARERARARYIEYNSLHQIQHCPSIIVSVAVKSRWSKFMAPR